jgi:hypothetical protein
MKALRGNRKVERDTYVSGASNARAVLYSVLYTVWRSNLVASDNADAL